MTVYFNILICRVPVIRDDPRPRVGNGIRMVTDAVAWGRRISVPAPMGWYDH